MLRHSGWFVVLGLCTCGHLATDPDGGLRVDAGEELLDAGAADAGSDADAGADDAGVSGDAGLDGDGGLNADAGATDAGRRDAGPPFDAGACSFTALATAGELAGSPRATPFLELMLLQADPSLFVVDDAQYARVERDFAYLTALDAGRLGYIPEWGESLLVRFDATGATQVADGTYTGWDCLNWYYRGQHTGSFSSTAVVRFEPTLQLPRLAAEYAALPHVVDVQQNAYGVLGVCGAELDLCLDLTPDGGTWQWLWYTSNANDCQHQWRRLLTQPDGGVTFDEWPADAGVPWGWLDQSTCEQRLWSTRGRRDAGP